MALPPIAVGDKYGQLTVVEFVERRAPHTYWRASCDCGKELVATANNMRRGNTLSCGCSRTRGMKYSPQTGMFYRRNIPVTHVGKNGYRAITFNRKRYYAHRLAWELMHGPIPEGLDVDHINRNRTDNRISNLRPATRLQNNRNSERYKQGITVYYRNDKRGRQKRWCVRYVDDRGNKKSPNFLTKDEAEEVANKLREKRKLRGQS